MRLNLSGEFYTTRSLTAASQRCFNLLKESIETAGGSGKGTAYLRGSPGFHLLANLNGHAGNVRGFWSGGGRCFVVVGQWLYEINQSGSIIASGDLGANDTLPVWMDGNGNQLGIVANGQFYLATGSGGGSITGVQARFQLNGTVTAVATAVTWQSGDKFTPFMAGGPINISGHDLLVSVYTDTTHITVSSSLGGGAGTGYLLNFGGFSWASGDLFNDAMVGLPIVIDGVSYVVQSVLSPQSLELENPDRIVFPQIGPVTFNAVQPNLAYSAPGGDLVTAVTGAYLDGTFYVQRPSGGTPDLGRQVNFSAVNDGTSWAGLDFFTKEAAADYLQAIFADREQLYLTGTASSEVWQNDATTGLPTRIPGAAAAEGNAARYAMISMGQHIYYLGGSPGGGAAAYRLDGFTPTRISTHAVEEQWNEFASNIQGAVGWWYLEDGHYFWVICLSNSHAWVYDATEKVWHERGAGNADDGVPYIPWFHTYIPEWTSGSLLGLHIVGAYNSAKVYVMSSSFSDEDGGNVTRTRDLPYIYGGMGNRVYVGRFSLDMDTGEIPSGPAPLIYLSWSDDNGQTVSTPEGVSFGTHGQYGLRVYWLAQGSAETSRIPRISYTGQLAITLIDAEAEIDIGTT